MLEAVHSRQSALVRVESGERVTGRVINIAHKHARLSPAFKPIMMAAVHLNHLPKTGLPQTPLPMRTFFTRLVSNALFNEPKTQGLIIQLYFISFKELLGGKRGAEI